MRRREAKSNLFGGREGGSTSAASAQLVATSDLGVGAPVCVAYGGDTAGQLALDHGFVSEPVEAAVVATFALEASDPYYEEKLLVVEGAGLGASASWRLVEDAPPPDELLAYLRLVVLGASDAFLLEPVFADVLWREHLALPVSAENEAAALDVASRWADDALAQLGAAGDDVRTDLATLAAPDDALDAAGPHGRAALGATPVEAPGRWWAAWAA